MHVSKALQKAKIVVNEDGTKAAAATSKYFYCKPYLGLKCSAEHKAVCFEDDENVLYKE